MVVHGLSSIECYGNIMLKKEYIPATTGDQGNSDEKFYDSPEHPVNWESSCSTEPLTGVRQEENMKDRTEYQSNVQPTSFFYGDRDTDRWNFTN